MKGILPLRIPCVGDKIIITELEPNYSTSLILNGIYIVREISINDTGGDSYYGKTLVWVEDHTYALSIGDDKFKIIAPPSNVISFPKVATADVL